MTNRAAALSSTLWLLATLSGCSDDAADSSSPSEESVTFSASDWQILARDEDPFANGATELPSCDDFGIAVEDDALEIDTGLCGFVTLEQPVPREVTKGERLYVSLSHYDLEAPEPAQALAAVAFNDCVVWSREVSIPGEAAAYDDTLRVGCGLAAGDHIRFHLENHGQNNWQVRDIRIEP